MLVMSVSIADGYSEDDIMYKWGKKAKEAVSIDPNVRLPQFSVSHLFVGVRTFQLSTGTHKHLPPSFVTSLRSATSDLSP